MAVSEFWEMTPRETLAAIEAANWRAEQRHRQNVALAWHTAALTRAKRLPSLKRLLATGLARPLRGEELERRRQEFEEMTANLDLSRLNEKLKERPKR